MLHEALQQIELAGVSSTGRSPRQTRRPRRIEDEVGHAQQRLGPGRVPAQDGTDPRHQLLQHERLGQVVVGAALQAGDFLRDGVARREHDDRRTAGRAQLPADAHAVQTRQHQIEHHQIGCMVADGGQAGESVGDHLYAIAMVPQPIAQNRRDGRVIFYH